MDCRELIKKLRNYGGGTEGIKLANLAADVLERLQGNFIELVIKSGCVCNYCKHNIECKVKECPKYIQGRRCWDDKRCHHDWVLSCKDFDFGTCDMLKNTPCNGCVKNNYKGFEWRGDGYERE